MQTVTETQKLDKKTVTNVDS